MTVVGVEREVERLETRYGIVKTFRFALAGAMGFGVTEAVLAIGLLLFYGKLGVPHASFSSLGLLSLDVLSLVVGVSASFVVNERITVKEPKVATSETGSRFDRFMKFQAVSGVGNTGIIVVQLILLTALEVSPVLGTIIGAVVTYPIVYFISIKYVWKAHEVR
jgi:putative flippase GtrA